MHRRAAGSLPAIELDAMIARAKVACERYRRSADAPGLSSLTARMRRDTLRVMEKALARLQVQRAAAND